MFVLLTSTSHFFSFFKTLIFFKMLKIKNQKYTLKLILAISQNILNILQKKYKWLVDIQYKTNIRIFYF